MASELKRIFLKFFQQTAELLPSLILAIILLALFFFFGKMFYKIVGLRIQTKWKNSIVSGFIAMSVKWVIYILGFLVALNVLGFTGVATNIVAGAGVSAIILGFAFKDIGENFLAGILLTVNRPFEIGDIIEADGHKGTVRNLDLRLTHLRSVEGKDIYLPNAALIKNTVINYTRDGYLRVNFMVGIAPECDIEQARKLILDILKNDEMILTIPSPNVLVTSLGEFTTDLQVLFWVDILPKRDVPDTFLGNTIRSRIIRDVKKTLDDHGIYMPSQVIEHKNYMGDPVSFNTKKDSL